MDPPYRLNDFLQPNSTIAVLCEETEAFREFYHLLKHMRVRFDCTVWNFGAVDETTALIYGHRGELLVKRAHANVLEMVGYTVVSASDLKECSPRTSEEFVDILAFLDAE